MDAEELDSEFQPAAGDLGQGKPTMKPKNQEPESSNNNGGLHVKLKAPKVESLDRNHQQPAPELTRFCEFCNKGFSSGKALGGHMSMHVQSNKAFFQSKKNYKNVHKSKTAKSCDLDQQGIENDSSMMMRHPVCYVCNKEFPSMKSLFGHMRAHPEREWRGLEPPPRTSKNSSSSTLSDASPPSNGTKHQGVQMDSCFVSKRLVPDLSKALPRWSSSARRGRKSSGSDSSDSASDSDLSTGTEEQMEEAVHDLLMLAQANPQAEMYEATNSNFFNTNTNPKSQVIDYVETNSKKRKEIDGVGFSIPRENMKFDGKKCGGENGDWKGKGVLGIGVGCENPKNYVKLGFREDNNNKMEEVLSDGQNSEGFVVNASMKRRKRRKMNLVDLEDDHIVVGATRQHKLRYKCTLCGKTFPTHQALGGHMSSHNKLKNTVNLNLSSMMEAAQSASADRFPVVEDGHNADQTQPAAPLDQDQVQHKCTVCNKTFPTGQALGGHKRCHWSGPTEQQLLVGNAPGEASQNNRGKKVLNFDLNEPAPME